MDRIPVGRADCVNQCLGLLKLVSPRRHPMCLQQFGQTAARHFVVLKGGLIGFRVIGYVDRTPDTPHHKARLPILRFGEKIALFRSKRSTVHVSSEPIEQRCRAFNLKTGILDLLHPGLDARQVYN
ncbi:Uncharacterised protein [Burkholderia pseudomallei]|nr:Uncharacterised protein [Burkholderia pseudomallei]VBY48896.1 Uncharacterised protein [Burkholderia pseudomallei]VBZ77170.1 Uncharacterised protein [Burkholderia pseudomallei]